MAEYVLDDGTIFDFEEDEELDESSLWDSNAAKKAEKQIKKENRKSKVSNFISGLFGSDSDTESETKKSEETATKKENNSLLIFGICAGVVFVGLIVLAIVKRK